MNGCSAKQRWKRWPLAQRIGGSVEPGFSPGGIDPGLKPEQSVALDAGLKAGSSTCLLALLGAQA